MRFLLIFLILLSLTLVACSSEQTTQAQIKEPVYCPRGVSNDPYPGQCGKYVDKDNNGICDLGE